MSFPYFGGDHGGAADLHDLDYSVYDPRYVQAPDGPLGASPHLDSGGFWYRSDLSEAQYGNGTSDYGRGIPMSVSEHIKHRRTRSGCFTCRSRRVKVISFLIFNDAVADNSNHSAMRLGLFVNVSTSWL